MLAEAERWSVRISCSFSRVSYGCILVIGTTHNLQLQTLRRHQAAGDRVIVVTGCEHALVSGILQQLGLANLEVLASQLRRGWLGMRPRWHNVGRRKVEKLARRMAAAAQQSAPTKSERSGKWGFSMRVAGWARSIYTPKADVSVSVNEYSGEEFERVKIELDDLTPDQAEVILRLAARYIK